MPTRSFQQLIKVIPPARREKIEKRFQESLASIPLEERGKAILPTEADGSPSAQEQSERQPEPP